MALLSITENTKRGGGSSSRSIGIRKAKRTFIVTYDAQPSLAEVETAAIIDNTDPENPVVSAAIPALYEELAGDTTRIVTDVSVNPHDDSGLVFDVKVTYETEELGEFGENPLTVPVDYDWDFSASSQTYFKDTTAPTAKYTVTSAGEPFENLLEREVGEIVVTITDNITPSAWNPATAAQYMADPATAINSAAMTIDGINIGIGQARFAGVKCSGIKTSNNVQYRTRSITLKLRASWDHKVDDRGFNELVAGKLREIVKDSPPKVDKPWPLDGAGAKKALATDAPAELTFLPYPKRDFSTWGIT